MEVLLVVGNFINGGTFRGDCAGFKMDALIKTLDTKTADNKSHLLMYLERKTFIIFREVYYYIKLQVTL